MLSAATLWQSTASSSVMCQATSGAGTDSKPMHLLVDSTSLKLCGKG